jgi:SPP1 gp7 family putative phage head morphogenesis protein
VARAGLGGGKGSQEGEAENVESVSTKPMEDYVVSVINSLSRRYLNADKNVTFVLNDRKGAREEMERSKALQTALFSGQKTLNDVQGELGQNLYDMPEADEPFIVAGNAITFLKGMLSVNTTGETVGQNETQSNEGQDAQGNVAQNQNQTSVSESQAPKAGVGKDIPAVGAPADQKSAMTDELKDFGRFVKSRHKRGNWRAFDFTTFDSELADNLNEQAYFIVKGATPMPENIYEWASDIVNSEITDTPKGLVTKREMHELPSYPQVEAVSKKHSKAIGVALAAGISGVGSAIAQALRAVPKPLEDVAQMKAVAQGAVRSNVLMNNAKAVNVLKDIYTAGSYAGAVDASRVVRSDAVLAGRGLQSLLDKAGITIQGINQTTMTRISDSLLLGISEGMSARDIGTAIDLIINDPSRADIIAVTETNRAYNASAVDTYQSAGIEQFDWLAYDGACAECLDQELANPHDITDDYPPEHPSCRCTVAAVLPDTSTSTGE